MTLTEVKEKKRREEYGKQMYTIEKINATGKHTLRSEGVAGHKSG